MKKFTFVSLFVLMVLSLVFVFTGCSLKVSSGNKTPIKIMYWGSVEEIAAVEKIVKKIEKKYPNIKIILEHVATANDTSRYTQKLLTEAAANSGPDIAFCEVNIFVNLFDKNIFANLNPFIQSDASFNTDKYWPQILHRFTRNGNLYILPRDVAPFAVVYYNKNLFDEAGVAYPTDDWDMNEFLDKAKKLTKVDASGHVTQYGFYGWPWVNFVYSFGGSLVDNVDNPKHCTLGSKESMDGLQFYVDLMYKYKVMPRPQALDSGTLQMFKTGRLAMYNSGIWESPQLQGMSFNWDVAMFPKGPTGKRGFGSGGSGYGILQSSLHKKEAWLVLKELASDDAMVDLAKIVLAQPASKKMAESDVWAKSDKKPLNKGMLNKAVKYITFDPFTSQWSFINSNIINIKLSPVFLGEKTVREVVPLMIPEINEQLNK